MKFAALDPIIAILVAVGWFIVKALLDRRRDADEWSEMELPRIPRPGSPLPPPGERTVPAGPRPPMIPPPIRPGQGAPQPPPIVRRPEIIQPVLIMEEEGPTRADLARLKESQESYARAARLQQTIASRLSAIDQQTTTHKPAQPIKRTRPPAAAHLLRTLRNPTTVRQAFLAQFVLNPPKALE